MRPARAWVVLLRTRPSPLHSSPSLGLTQNALNGAWDIGVVIQRAPFPLSPFGDVSSVTGSCDFECLCCHRQSLLYGRENICVLLSWCPGLVDIGETWQCPENLAPDGVVELETPSSTDRPEAEVPDCAFKPQVAPGAHTQERRKGCLPGRHPRALHPLGAGALRNEGSSEVGYQKASRMMTVNSPSGRGPIDQADL